MDLHKFAYYFFNCDPIHTGTGHLPADLWWIEAIRIVLRVLLGMFTLLLGVPILVWWERRLLGWMQQRQGPNRVGPWGILQTIADGVKLLLKEDMNPAKVDTVLFVLAPIIFLLPTLIVPGVIPWHPSRTWGAAAPNLGVGVLFILAWSSLGVYGVVMAGWASNNKYSLLGGLRASAQMISYELGMGLAIITVVLMTGSLGLQDIVEKQGYNQYGIAGWNVLAIFPMGFIAMLIYMVCMLAETNRAPFDLPEAETELVAGYHTEYTSMKFATFFMAEYGNMVVTSAIWTTLFLGGYKAPVIWLDGPWLAAHIPNAFLSALVYTFVPVAWFLAKVLAGLYFFIWVRATMPRLRYDMLMKFGWQGLLPIALVNVLLVAVGMTLGWPIAAASWLVIFVISLIAFAKNKRIQLFTANTHRNRTIQLYSSAQPYHANPEHPGSGGQKLPPDMPVGGKPMIGTDQFTPVVETATAEKG